MRLVITFLEIADHHSTNSPANQNIRIKTRTNQSLGAQYLRATLHRDPSSEILYNSSVEFLAHSWMVVWQGALQDKLHVQELCTFIFSACFCGVSTSNKEIIKGERKRGGGESRYTKKLKNSVLYNWYTSTYGPQLRIISRDTLPFDWALNQILEEISERGPFRIMFYWRNVSLFVLLSPTYSFFRKLSINLKKHTKEKNISLQLIH